jgi:hypothetical protein
LRSLLLNIIILSFLLFLPQLGFSSISAQCNFNSSNYLKELSQLKAIKKIEVNVIKHKKWTKNLMQATFGSGPILQKYKKKFNADIFTYYEFGSCQHRGKIRLHGDWKDHIDFLEGGKFIQSLDISLDSGSVANFVKFKLLLPKTRNGSTEIILTHLLRYLGFLAPRTSLVDVEVNGQLSSMIIQEKSNKELLESMGAREGPLFEGDESYLFQNFKNYNHYDLINISLSKMTNSNWANSSYESSKISLSAFSILQNTYMAFAAKAPENNYSLDWGLLSNGNDMALSKWAKYEILLFAAQASHGLIPHNRKFYFNSFYSAFEPVYYDGAPRSLVGEWIRIKPDFQYYPFLKEEHFDELMYMLNSINQNHFISSLQEENILDASLSIKIFQDISSKILILKNDFLEYRQQFNTQNRFSESSSLKTFQKNLEAFLPDSLVLNISEDRNSNQFFKTKLCTMKYNDCEESTLPFSNLGTTLEKKSLDLDGGNQFSALFIMPTVKVNTLINEHYFIDGNLRIQSSPTTAISFDAKNKILAIKLNNFFDWALIIDSNLEGIEVQTSSDLFGNIPPVYEGKRLNTRGLTGCISFYNTVFDKSKIIATHQSKSCEDTINIINSKGHLSEIKIISSLSDGLDVDFSSLTIDSLMVDDAGNDCADFSGGTYSIGNAVLLNCKDKGISIGEKSSVLIADLTIQNSYIGIASKDSSVSSITTSNFDNVEICVDAYQKKQEFYGSIISINQLKCDGERTRKDSNSNILYREL